MKKLLIGTMIAVMAVSTLFSAGITRLHTGAEEITAVGKAAYLCDYDSGAAVYARQETKRLPIASMCKIMTLLLSFEAVESGNLSYDEMITVSANASGMGGSQVFLETGLSYSADELMKTVAVCSANDSCVALAERISGSEAAFVSRMNERAKELGAENTLFANCTGLPKEPQYSCAKDVALMLREMLSHEKYYEYSKIWLEDFAHPDGRTTQITNTNKLIRTYSGCDGGKTGFTSEAGFCLAATARRGEMRLIAVVIGADSSASRFLGISAMLDYCFNCYETQILLEAGKPIEEKACVRGSKEKEIAVAPEKHLKAFLRRGEKGEFSVTISINDDLKAPIAVGDAVGEAVLYSGGVEIGRSTLVALEKATHMNWWDAFRETLNNWQ